MRIFFQEMMLHHPGVIVAQPVGGLELRQRVLVKPVLVAGLPRPRQLQLVKDAEFHGVAPTPLVEKSVVPAEGESSLRDCMAIPRHGSRLAWNARMVSLCRLSRPPRCPPPLHRDP